VRNHIIHVSPESGLVTIAGGKWTTYRKMAEETVDVAVKQFGLEGKVKTGCVTDKLRLVGSEGWSRNMFIGLIQRYGLETDVAKHLSENYGDRAWTVCALASGAPTGKSWPVNGVRISEMYPFIEAEITYAIHHEYALTPIDVLARRTRLAFLNVREAYDALPRVVEIMSKELGWSKADRKRYTAETVEFLKSMGLDTQAERGGRGRLDPAELSALQTAFSTVGPGDGIKKGEVMRLVKEGVPGAYGYGEIPEKDWVYVLDEVLGSGSGDKVGWDEFVEICENLKEVSFVGGISGKGEGKHEKRRVIPVEKSGGGV